MKDQTITAFLILFNMLFAFVYMFTERDEIYLANLEDDNNAIIEFGKREYIWVYSLSDLDKCKVYVAKLKYIVFCKFEFFQESIKDDASTKDIYVSVHAIAVLLRNGDVQEKWCVILIGITNFFTKPANALLQSLMICEEGYVTK